MKRLAAYDPPEYVQWTRDDDLVREFDATLTRDPERAAVVARLSAEQKLDLYRGLLRNRLSDIALKRLVRQGVISKAWLGTGEEAATIGPVHALRRAAEVGDGTHDVVAPMIRNSGACHEMGMPIADIFRAYMATEDGPSRGRDGHYGAPELGVIPPISHVGDMVPVVTGIALSFRLRGADRVAMTWIGDGSTKTGVAHEGLNFAAVQRVPAVFIIQNNQVALGTRLDQHHRSNGATPFADWPGAYGMWGGVFDGNNVLDAYALTSVAVERCRRGEGPALLIAETFRMGGHATHDEAEARRMFAGEMFTRWGRRDPIALYEAHLGGAGVSAETLAAIEHDVEAEIEAAEAEAMESRRTRMPQPESALLDVYGTGAAGQEG
ncbi:MAG TPA: thiamine pyrophosphate-dependent dehydrogenase E1 component subunit alpha [Gemmatimonadaceae bacterium]|nr:thiamine pyrophosphate-dependent dehydrogenase E1 component subunit alpha [Gemmatimonadaceae bacterium]